MDAYSLKAYAQNQAKGERFFLLFDGWASPPFGVEELQRGCSGPSGQLVHECQLLAWALADALLALADLLLARGRFVAGPSRCLVSNLVPCPPAPPPPRPHHLPGRAPRGAAVRLAGALPRLLLRRAGPGGGWAGGAEQGRCACMDVCSLRAWHGAAPQAEAAGHMVASLRRCASPLPSDCCRPPMSAAL